MNTFSADSQQRLAFFREMISCDQNVYCWTYNASGELTETNCTTPVLDTIFRSTGCRDYMLSYAARDWRPLILSAPMGIMWCACFTFVGDRMENACVVGPVFNNEMSLASLEEALKQYQIPINWRGGLVELLLSLPTVSFTYFFHTALMLHFCQTGVKLTRSDIQYMSAPEEKANRNPAVKGDRYKTWMAEQALLRMIREGDLNYAKALATAVSVSQGIPASSGDQISQAIISGVVFTSLCVRAAIDGALSPEIAYARGDMYIQKLMSCKTVSEVAALNHSMYDDFVRQVHAARENPKYSPQVRSCLDYIEMNLEEELSLKQLAQRTGYSEYYLSRKFKKEMGVTVAQYIKISRIERAKMLLTTTNLSIIKIAEQLRFCASSYFSDSFKEITGMSPQEWRDSRKKW